MNTDAGFIQSSSVFLESTELLYLILPQFRTQNRGTLLLELLWACCFLGMAITGPADAGASKMCYHVVNVDIWDVLYIRTKMNHLSKPVGAIAADHSGVIRATGHCQPQNANSRRQWCPIDYFPLPAVKLSGFVKAYFIERRACPPT